MKPEDFSTNGERLLYIQTHLKAPKSQHNSFGNYDYRSAEDINEASKPLLAEVGATLVPTHRTYVEDGWHYVETTVVLKNVADDSIIAEAPAPAREQETRPKMDASQLTGGALSYSKKYAYNNIFLLDDTRDADTMKPVQEAPEKKAPPPPPMKRIITFDGFVKQEGLPAKLVTAFLEEKAVTTTSTLEVMQEKALSKPKSFVTAFNKWFEERKTAEESQDDTPPAIQETN